MSTLNDKTNALITDLIQDAANKRAGTPNKYWYPLSSPTFGVPEIREALESMCSFQTSMGEKTRAYEAAFAKFQGSSHAVMVNSGSSADLLLSFLLVNRDKTFLQPGDEILVPVVTWPTQIWSVLMAGLKVRLVDVDPATLNCTADKFREAIGPKTKGIFLVHLMGNPCQMDSILALAKEKNLTVFEDCCEALGASWNGTKVGNFGVGGAFSFFFSHHITTMEGGMISTNDAETADRLRILRAHGWLRNVSSDRYNLAGLDIDSRYTFVDWGFNVRPTELQAGFGLHQLQRLGGFTERRNTLSNRFFSFIDKSRHLSRPQVHPSATPVWMALPLMVDAAAPFGRNDLTRHLEAAGVETRPVVAGNLARQPAASLFAELGLAKSYPGAEAIHQRGFYIGLSPMTQDAEMDRLVQVFSDFLAKY